MWQHSRSWHALQGETIPFDVLRTSVCRAPAQPAEHAGTLVALWRQAYHFPPREAGPYSVQSPTLLADERT